jgi:hypothetical protein
MMLPNRGERSVSAMLVANAGPPRTVARRAGSARASSRGTSRHDRRHRDLSRHRIADEIVADAGNLSAVAALKIEPPAAPFSWGCEPTQARNSRRDGHLLSPACIHKSAFCKRGSVNFRFDSLKTLDPKRPIREATEMLLCRD